MSETLLGFYIRTRAVLELVVLVATWPAWLAHELAHYVAALLARKRPAFRLTPTPAVEYDYPAPKWVRYAPTIHGLKVGTAWLVLFGAPDVTPLSAYGLLLFAVYVYPSVDDRDPVPVEESIVSG